MSERALQLAGVARVDAAATSRDFYFAKRFSIVGVARHHAGTCSTLTALGKYLPCKWANKSKMNRYSLALGLATNQGGKFKFIEPKKEELHFGHFDKLVFTDPLKRSF